VQVDADWIRITDTEQLVGGNKRCYTGLTGAPTPQPKRRIAMYRVSYSRRRTCEQLSVTVRYTVSTVLYFLLCRNILQPARFQEATFFGTPSSIQVYYAAKSADSKRKKEEKDTVNNNDKIRR